MGGARTVEKRTIDAFKKAKEDILELKKTRKNLLSQLNDVNLRQAYFRNHYAKEDHASFLDQRLTALEQKYEEWHSLPGDVTDLEETSVRKKEYDKALEKLQKEITKANDEILKIKQSKELVTQGELKTLEKKLFTLEEARSVVLDDVKKDYLDAKEVGIEMQSLREEFFSLKDKMRKMRKDLTDFPRWRLFSNVLFLLALLSFLGALVSVYLEYALAANFLAIEGGALLLVGLIVRVVVALVR